MNHILEQEVMMGKLEKKDKKGKESKAMIK